MRIADAVAALERRPGAIVVGNDGAADAARRVAEQLGLPLDPDRGDGARDDGVAVVVTAIDQSVGDAVAAGLERSDGIGPVDHCLVLLDARPDGLPVEAVAEAAGEHGLELQAVLDVAHPVVSVVLHLVAGADPALSAARTQLLLEQESSRRARTTAAAAARELDRRGQRIDALQAEVTELRERLETLEVTHEREVATQQKQLTVLRRDVRDLERSTSYRIGHALVRVLTEPRLLLRLPARLLRRLRS